VSRRHLFTLPTLGRVQGLPIAQEAPTIVNEVAQAERNRDDSKGNFWAFDVGFMMAIGGQTDFHALRAHTPTAPYYNYFSIVVCFASGPSFFLSARSDK